MDRFRRDTRPGILAVCGLLLAACASSPIADQEAPSAFLPADPHSTLGRSGILSDDGLSNVRVLDTGADAFLERAALIDSAEQSIDAQYYIWNSDLTGRYLALRLLAAADRGVRVRLLLDDINTAGRDAVLATLAAHRNIELRIYNPFEQRSGVRKLLQFAFDFSRLNRRMHNKSLTVDGAVAVVGGRNIGDEYFDAHAEFNFRDRDVVAIGPVVPQTGAMFDDFWNSAYSVPIGKLTSQRIRSRSAAELDEALREDSHRLREMGYQLPADTAERMQYLEQSRAAMRHVPAHLVHDEPPVPGHEADTDKLQPTASALADIARAASREILIESAYLVLDDASLEVVRSMIGRGVRVRALTNSLAANDVTANHAAYARRRVPILESGIELHELRPDAVYCAKVVVIENGCSAERSLGLHSKTFVFDRRIVAIGSMNLNLRSAYLNAETVMIIDSPELAGEVTEAIDRAASLENSWSVTLDDGHLLWRTKRAGKLVICGHEPDTSWWRRFKSQMIASLPLEKYL